MRKRIIVLMIIVLAFFIGCASMYFLVKTFPFKREIVNTNVTKYKIEEEASFDAIDKVYDAVVVVEAYVNDQKNTSGTGFVYKKDDVSGYILTNYHVVEGADEVRVILSNGDVVDASILGVDDIGDIAVLSIMESKVNKVAEIGNSNDIQVGSTVFAIGAPMGTDYSGTTTKGCISAKNRMVSYSQNDGASEAIMRVVQTDAAINPGNSGGPLISLAGQVIGVTSSKLILDAIEGIGFAIPIEDAMKYTQKLEKGEIIERPFLGVSLIDASDNYQLFINDITISKTIKTGSVIISITKNSLADIAGLKKGDVIVKIGNVDIKNTVELRYQLYTHEIGDKVKITYYRRSNINSVDITLEKE